MTRAFALLLSAGCSNVLGIGDLSGPSDGPIPPSDVSDGPIEVPNTIRITGTVQQVDGISGMTAPLPNASVSLVEQPAGVGSAASLSDAQGRFELVIETGGRPLDGAIRAAAPNERTTVQYFTRPIVEDVDATLQVYDEQLFQMVAQMCQLPFNSIAPVYLVFVIDAANNPVEGATLSSMPDSTFCAQNTDGSVTNANKTGVGGFAFNFQLPPGLVTLSAGGPTRTFNGESQSTMLVPLSNETD